MVFKERYTPSIKKRIHSKETINRISEKLKGRKQSKEHIRKRSLAMMNNTHGFKNNHAPWNKGLKKELQPKFGKQHSNRTKLKMSKKRKENIKIGKSVIFKGKNHWNWKGGITPYNKSLRNSFKFKQWRGAVFRRDNFICQECGIKSGERHSVFLHPHHIKLFSLFTNLRFNPYNGITLCRDCHKKVTWREEEYEQHFQNKLLMGIMSFNKGDLNVQV